METLPAKKGGRRPGAGRPKTVITDEERACILDTYMEIHNENKVAEKLNFPIWTVRRVLAEQPSGFRLNVLKDQTYETIHAALDTIGKLLPKVPAREFADIHRMVVGLTKALTELELGGVARGPKNAMQTIINIGGEEAARLKETIVEGEVVDHSDS